MLHTVLRRLAARLTVVVMAVGLLLAGGGTASAAPPDSHRVATWNMQVGTDRWSGAQILSRTFDVLALQEVPGTPPAGAFHLGDRDGIRSYLWPIGGGEYRYLYILLEPSRNLGMVTATPADQVTRIQGVYRDALGVVYDADDTVFVSAHAASNGGRPNDAAALVRRVARYAYDEVIGHWAVLGDFNRGPQDLVGDNLPAGSRIYNSGLATQQNGNELDYMVANVDTQNWQAAVDTNYGSDHWPVGFSALQAAGEPTELTIHADNSDRLLDVYGTQTTNGTHVIIYHPNGGANQRWKLFPVGRTGDTGSQLYRIVSTQSDKCLDVNRGQGSRDGDWLNIWDCHGRDGQPTPGGYPSDTQNFSLEHPDPRFPNLTALRDNGTDRYANVDRNRTGDGTWLIQWPYQTGSDGRPAANETFYLHPRF
ncbi:RICIN domain-containing protein [Streptomyces sp. NPDC005017]|uniref:RICIN domain-containing protein n=1 Tax=Streptomyces sp. NPDC005017 TaxID=3364706 RepID=UPI0036B2112C